MERQTYVIPRDLVEKTLCMADYVSAVEEAFRLYGIGGVQMPPKVYLDFGVGDLRCMPAYVPSLDIAGVKNVNVHPGNRRLPTVMATITLVDPKTGFPLAVMDGTHITKMRTGAAGGVAAKYLSRRDSRVAGFVGAGVQARTQLEGLLVTRPMISRVLVYDIRGAAMRDFAKYAGSFGLDVRCVDSVREAVYGADIVATTTPVRAPVVKADYVCGGTHINAIGADAPGKQELESVLLKRAVVVVDCWGQASHSGEINVPLSEGVITRDDVYGELGEIVAEKKPGRTSSEQITVFDSTGLAVQDIVSAYAVFKRLLRSGRKLRRVKIV